MAITVVEISSVTPRGGPAGTSLTIVGTGFGAAAGAVRFDPLGVNLAGTIAFWGPNLVTVTTPAGLPDNQFVTLLLETAGANDAGQVPFWVPAIAADGLDYQYPAFEEGPLQDVDDPRVSEASEFNRMLARVLSIVAGIGDMTKAVYDTDDNGRASLTAPKGLTTPVRVGLGLTLSR